PAWAIQKTIARIQGSPTLFQEMVNELRRPMGLSLTPIVFSYHIASAYVLANLLHRFGYLRAGPYLVLALALLIGAAANGTRSLVIGIILHEVLHNFTKLNLRTLILSAAIGAVTMMGYFYLETSGSRVVSFGDASAAGRLALYKYGLLLVRDYPLGLGWGFDPAETAWRYWEHFSSLAKAQSVFRLKIHNAFINFYLTYGVLGLIAIGFAFYINPKMFILIVTTFAAYLIHSMFHNDGVFLGDVYFWYSFAVLLYIWDEQERVRDRKSMPAAPAIGAVAAGIQGPVRPLRHSRR
ncbi:MAG: O-antigen ligase family protein, partial [Alphaproteobacteria bacterium]